MYRYTTALLVSLLVIMGCNQPQTAKADKPERTIHIDVSDSPVVMLDGKEIHVALLEDHIARLGESYELSAELSIAADATLGVVNDVQQAVHQESRKIAQKMAE